MKIKAIEDMPITFDIRPYLISRGWSINSRTSISHEDSRSGYLVYNGYFIQPNTDYKITMDVSNISGINAVSLGGSEPTPLQGGYNEITINSVDSSPISFFSDGNITITNLTITGIIGVLDTDPESESTIVWSEDRKRWVSFRDYVPESGFSMFTNLFTLKDGNLWIHTDEGTVNNNFYGKQYYSTIKFPVASVGVKTYHSIAIHSNKVMGTTEDGIETELGNVTDLITFDFNSREGIHYANKLRDAILNEKLKGRYIVVELSDEETKEQKLQLFKFVIKSEVSTPNE